MARARVWAEEEEDYSEKFASAVVVESEEGEREGGGLRFN